MADKQTIVHSGQRVIATDGKIYTVAYERKGIVWAYGDGCYVPITVSNDAWGGEHDQEIGIV